MNVDEKFLEIADAFIETCWACRRRGEEVPAATWRAWRSAKADYRANMLAEFEFLLLKRIRATKRVSAIVAIEMFLLKSKKCS